jgi:two-component system, OmpR family, sensor histidine kinase KdpD
VVENLAHANLPGGRHPSRYQDVVEILEAGVDVYASLSVANLQSLGDIVQQISGVKVNEVIPDSLFQEAEEIQLVDQSPAEIMEQFNQGTFHLPHNFAVNGSSLFRTGNLAALRELAARKASDWMDARMREYMSSRDIAGPWPARDRVLSCISSQPLGERVVRAGKQLAEDLKAEWFVLYVETPGHAGMSRQKHERLQGILRLAEELGGQVFQVSDISTAEAILRFCREYNITRLVIGKSPRPRWYELLRGSVTDQVIRHSGGINLTLIPEEPAGAVASLKTDLRLRSPAANYLFSVLLVGAASFVTTLLHSAIEPSNLVMIYLAAVVLAAVFLGRGPAILASILSVLLFDFLSIEPRLSLTVADTQYLITFLGLLAVGLIISNSAALLRDQVQVLRRREADTSALNTLSRELTGISGLEAIVK